MRPIVPVPVCKCGLTLLLRRMQEARSWRFEPDQPKSMAATQGMHVLSPSSRLA